MTSKFLPLALLLAVAVFPAVRAADVPLRHVAVTGEGEVTVQPDRARLRLGVSRLNPDLRAAEAEVNKVVRAYLAEARGLGVKDEQLNSTGVGINPEYVWDEKERSNRLVGYRVNRDIEVLVLALDRLGDLVLSATKVGINQVQPPQLEYSKAREAQQQALVKAALEAQARAKLLADTLGMKLGPVHQIDASDAAPPPPMPKMMAMRAVAADGGGNQEMGINAGELRYGASVNAEFELLTP